MGLLTSLVLSPLSLYWILSHYRGWLDRKTYSYMREVLPKPENPDSCSIKGAMEDELDGETIPGLGSMKDYNEYRDRERTTLLGEIRKDLRAMVRRLQAVRDFWRFGTEDEQDASVNNQDPPIVLTESIEANPQASSEPEAQVLQNLPPSVLQPEPRQRFSSSNINDPNLPAALSEPTAPDQPRSPALSSSSNDAMIPELESSTVQVTTHAGSNDTLHMNVEVAGAIPGAAPLYTSSFSASPRPAAVETVTQRSQDGKSTPPLFYEVTQLLRLS